MLTISVTLTRQAEGVYNQRLQNLAVTLDKVTVHKSKHSVICFAFVRFKMFFPKKDSLLLYTGKICYETCVWGSKERSPSAGEACS